MNLHLLQKKEAIKKEISAEIYFQKVVQDQVFALYLQIKKSTIHFFVLGVETVQ